MTTTTQPIRYDFVMPTAINLLNRVQANIVENFRRYQEASMALPSLYQLAFMVHHIPGELLLARGTVEDFDA